MDIFMQIDDIIRRETSYKFDKALTQVQSFLLSSNARFDKIKLIVNIYRLRIKFCSQKTITFRDNIVAFGFSLLFDEQLPLADNLEIIQFFFSHNRLDGREGLEAALVDYMVRIIPDSSEQDKINLLDAIDNSTRESLGRIHVLIFNDQLPLADNLEMIRFFFNRNRLDGREELEATLIAYLERIIPDSSEQDKINLLTALRNSRRESLGRIFVLLPERIRLYGATFYDFYKDIQNVHNSSVQSAVRQYIKSECADRSLNLDKCITEMMEHFTLTPEISKSLRFISIDTSNVDLANILCNVWKRIVSSPHKDALVKVLQEELTDMSGLCVTGCSTRLLNVFSGFDVGIDIKPPLFEEISMAWVNRLRKKDIDPLGFVYKTPEFVEIMARHADEFKTEMKSIYDTNIPDLDDILTSVTTYY